MNRDWKYVPFSDLFTWAKKSTIKSGDGIPNGKYKLFVCSDTEIKAFDKFLESTPSLVFGTGGRACCHIVSEPFAYSTDCAVAQTKSNDVYLKFYYYYLRRNNLSDLQATFTGSGLQHTSKKKIDKLLVPLIPYAEQARIVARIEELFSELDNGVQTLQTIKQQLAVYRQAVLKEAFEGKWLYQDRKSVFTNATFKEIDSKELKKLAEIPAEWMYVYLSDLGELSRGKSKHRPRNDERLFENGKYPFFQTGEVKSANKYLVHCEKKYGDFGLAQSKLWPVGTLCITIAANIAETCFLGVDGCFPDSIVGFTPKDALISKEYVRYFIEASKLRIWAFAPATAQKNINLTTLENLVIPYCNLEEQSFIVQEIESRLSVCDSIEKTVDTALAQAESMRQSILKKAFEGGLV